MIECNLTDNHAKVGGAIFIQKSRKNCMLMMVSLLSVVVLLSATHQKVLEVQSLSEVRHVLVSKQISIQSSKFVWRGCIRIHKQYLPSGQQLIQ